MRNDLISPDAVEPADTTSSPSSQDTPELRGGGGWIATAAVVSVLGLLGFALVNLRPRHVVASVAPPLIPVEPYSPPPAPSAARMASSSPMAIAHGTPVARGGGPRSASAPMHDVVRFDVAQSHLQPSAISAISRFARALQNDPQAHVRIEGRVDADSAHGASDGLSERRSDAVKFELIRRGVRADRIDVAHHATRNPTNADNTDRRPEHRRVDLTLVM